MTIYISQPMNPEYNLLIIKVNKSFRQVSIKESVLEDPTALVLLSVKTKLSYASIRVHLRRI